MGRYKSERINREIGLLSPIDRRVYQCTKLKKTDEMIESNVIKNSLKRTLGATIEEYDEQGNVMGEVSIAQKLVNSTIEEAIENPDTRKLKDLANILGEIKENGNNVNLTFNNPANLFKELSFEEEVIEADYKEV